MAASGKFDMSSGSPDRSIYTPRGSSTGAPLDRPGSFRENKETPILSSLPSMSRNSTSVTKVDVANFLHCLCFDSKSISANYKFSRQVEFNRLTSIAFGHQVDDSTPNTPKGKPLPSPAPEDLKRLKAGLRESSAKARERVKLFHGAMSGMNKCFPVIPSRKRSRLDGLSSERANASLSSERSGVGSSLGKAGTQTHAIASGFEPEPQVSEEKVKIAFPNKRTRTSMVESRTDTRGGTTARSSGNMDREVLRSPSTVAVQGELSVGVDSWVKPKLKKKRSGIKTDVSLSSVTTKPTDGFREAKQGMQPRLLADARLRLNDSHGFRQGVPSEVVVGKADGTIQPANAGVRSSTPKGEQDSYSQLHDRRDRSASVDKERANLGAVNKTNSKEDFNSPSPTSSTKMKSAARGPRSGSNVLNKLSPVVQGTTVASDWELSHSSSKISAAIGANNRKNTPQMQPSPPSVTQWASQRTQKLARSARRTNFVPISSSNDESPALDATSDVTGNGTGSGSTRRLSANSPQQFKLKGDQFSSPALSESEESGATETKVRDKIQKTDEVDEKASRVQKVSNLPPRTKKLVNEGDHGDGVRRQGRSGRGFTSTRSLMPITGEKLGNSGTAKQLRSARIGFEKTESKVGRPSSRKLSDRKPFTRQKQTTISSATDFHDDGHEELLAAAAAVTDPALCFSSPFWRRMEPYFSFISDSDLAYLKQQGNHVLTTQVVHPILNTCTTIPNGFALTGADRDSNHMRNPVLSPDVPLASFEVPLTQILMSALITEEECEEFSNDDLEEFDTEEIKFELEKLESNPPNHQLLGNFQLADCAGLNGYKVATNGRSINDFDPALLDTNMLSEKELISDLELLENDLLSNRIMEDDINSTEFQYCNMSLDERLLLELESVGISAELTGDEEASKEIGRLKEKHLGQVSTAKEAFVGKLFSSASETRAIQEKEFEHHALDKLLAIAYEKYMASWGPNPSGGKNTSNKMAKQAALAFVKRTLEHCHQFEDTGKSCFSEDFFRNIFISGSARLKDADTGSENHLAGGSLEIRSTAAMGSQQTTSVNNHDIYSFNLLDHSSEQFIGKEDSWLNTPSGIGGSFSSSAKGKRSERDREGKGSREGLPRNVAPKVGRPSANIKGDRKNKTKPKQKSAQSPASVSGLINKLPDLPKATLHPGSSGTLKRDNVQEDGDLLEDPIDLSHLQLPGMDDVFGGPDDLDGQGQDFGSWLNIDEELHDQDGFDGLEIPMDDLADLNFKF